MQKELIPLYVAEQGRTTQLCQIEFGLVEGFWNLDEYHRPKDEVLSDDGHNKNVLRKYPIGVSAALVPCELFNSVWTAPILKILPLSKGNYPLILTLWKVIPCLLTGNCV
jgi:acyl-CoA reductase-like NAD-dependent aldehyde dehydrogenase